MADADTGPCNLDDRVTPACLEWLYGIPTTPAKSGKATLAVTGYDLSWPSKSDLTVRVACW